MKVNVISNLGGDIEILEKVLAQPDGSRDTTRLSNLLVEE
jgi:hypothetical protein